MGLETVLVLVIVVVGFSFFLFRFCDWVSEFLRVVGTGE